LLGAYASQRIHYTFVIIIIIVDRTRSTHKRNKANVKKKEKIS